MQKRKKMPSIRLHPAIVTLTHAPRLWILLELAPDAPDNIQIDTQSIMQTTKQLKESHPVSSGYNAQYDLIRGQI